MDNVMAVRARPTKRRSVLWVIGVWVCCWIVESKVILFWYHATILVKYILKWYNLFYLWYMKSSKKPKKDFFCTNLRIDPKLADRVKKAADSAKRSLNKEIELTLEQRYVWPAFIFFCIETKLSTLDKLKTWPKEYCNIQVKSIVRSGSSLVKRGDYSIMNTDGSEDLSQNIICVGRLNIGSL